MRGGFVRLSSLSIQNHQIPPFILQHSYLIFTMAITIDMIKQLREATAAGMGACKEALTACNGNMDEAVKYLREKGLAVAAKRVDKESKQGIVALAEAADKKTMALAEVNCETDFVAKTEAFIKFVDDAAKVALEGKDIEQTLNDDYKMLLTKTGENVKIRRSERYVLEGNGVISGYIHMGGKIGVIVELSGGDKTLGKDVAMQIAAAKPQCIGREDVDQEALAHEREVLRKQALEEGKPEKIVEKMVDGRINKYYKEVCLVEQEFVKDSDKTIKDILAGVEVRRFARFEMGEGLEKKNEDFAAEVAAQMK